VRTSLITAPQPTIASKSVSSPPAPIAYMPAIPQTTGSLAAAAFSMTEIAPEASEIETSTQTVTQSAKIATSSTQGKLQIWSIRKDYQIDHRLGANSPTGQRKRSIDDADASAGISDSKRQKLESAEGCSAISNAPLLSSLSHPSYQHARDHNVFAEHNHRNAAPQFQPLIVSTGPVLMSPPSLNDLNVMRNHGRSTSSPPSVSFLQPQPSPAYSGRKRARSTRDDNETWEELEVERQKKKRQRTSIPKSSPAHGQKHSRVGDGSDYGSSLENTRVTKCLRFDQRCREASAKNADLLRKAHEIQRQYTLAPIPSRVPSYIRRNQPRPTPTPTVRCPRQVFVQTSAEPIGRRRGILEPLLRLPSSLTTHKPLNTVTSGNRTYRIIACTMRATMRYIIARGAFTTPDIHRPGIGT
jgi:hypothetical protein